MTTQAYIEQSSHQIAVQRGFANVSALGDSLVIAAVPGAKIRVLAIALIATGAVSVHFRSGTTPVSATLPLAANGGFVLPGLEKGWFETAAGEALNINLGTATATGVQVVYVLV
ncbi:MAG: hypothetical protein L0177_15335 [Chloroflexi bacterium]|nr:hypothetical protein [Chloroflexota bacterium]